MDISKAIVLLSLLIILIPNSHISAANPGFPDSMHSQDSIQLLFKTRIDNAGNDNIKRIEAHFEFGEYLNEEGKTAESILQFTKAFRIAQDVENDKQIANIGNCLANLYAATGNFEASNQTYKIALASAEKTNNSGEIAKISMNLASNYNYTGDYDKAIKHGLYALKTKESTQNLERICYHYIAMGNIFRENNNTVKWEEYVTKAYKMKDVEGCASLSDRAKIYNSLGGIAVQKGELEKGLLYYDTLFALSNKAGYEQGICTALTNSAGVYKQLGDYTKALEMANESEQYFGDNPYDVIFNNNFKAELNQLQGQYLKGLKLASENLKIGEIENYSTEKLKTLKLLYELNFHLKNWDKAFFWNDSLRATESRLRDEDIRQSLEELETRYETEKKEQQIELLTTENKLKNQRIDAGIALLVVLLIVILLIVYILQIRKKQSQLIQNELRQQVLRAQMNPHFIFNVMGSIQGFLYNNEAKKAAEYLGKFAVLMRSVLEFSSQETIFLKDEITMLKNYIELERARMKIPFDVDYYIDPKMETDFIEIPPMLLQPFVENAIKHGMQNLNYQGKLSLQFREKQDQLEVEILDNGSGFTKSNNIRHNSKALEIFQQRRKGIERRFKKELNFELQDLKTIDVTQHGVRVFIRLPILNHD